MASLALLCRYPLTLTGSARMQERPIGPLAEALSSIGGSVKFLQRSGYPPLEVSGRLRGGRVSIDGSVSSQFISSILIAAPYAETEVEIHIPSPPASASYLDITLSVMEGFGARVAREGYEQFTVSTRNRYSRADLCSRGRLFVCLLLLCPCRYLRGEGHGTVTLSRTPCRATAGSSRRFRRWGAR